MSKLGEKGNIIIPRLQSITEENIKKDTQAAGHMTFTVKIVTLIGTGRPAPFSTHTQPVCIHKRASLTDGHST